MNILTKTSIKYQLYSLNKFGEDTKQTDTYNGFCNLESKLPGLYKTGQVLYGIGFNPGFL